MFSLNRPMHPADNDLLGFLNVLLASLLVPAVSLGLAVEALNRVALSCLFGTSKSVLPDACAYVPRCLHFPFCVDILVLLA